MFELLHIGLYAYSVHSPAAFKFLSYFNKFDSRVQIFSNPMMFCNGATGDATCQHGEARHRGEKNVIMWYVNGFNFSTKHEIYTICIIQRIWTYRSHLLHITHILRRHLEFFIILNEQLQKKFSGAHSFSSHDASKINIILEI